MGFESRDYSRPTYHGGGGGGGSFLADSPTVKRILIITVAVFLGQLLIVRPVNRSDLSRRMPDGAADQLSDEEFNQALQFMPKVSVVQQWCELDTEKVLYKGQIWRLLTMAFCHDRMSIFHILFNMLVLVWFGRRLEARYGSREFLIFYLVAAVVAGAAYICLELITGERHGAIGASGAVMGVFCLYAMWYPRERIYMFMLIPIEIRFLLFFYVAYDLHPVLLALTGEPNMTGVAHSAHLGGLVFGFLYWRYGWRLETMWNRVAAIVSRKTGPRRHLKVHRPVPEETEPQNLDAEIDRVLAKISTSGEESLTPKERELLIQASRRYRNR